MAGHESFQITDWNQFLRRAPWEVFHIKASRLSPPSSHIGSFFKLALPSFASATLNPPECKIFSLLSLGAFGFSFRTAEVWRLHF